MGDRRPRIFVFPYLPGDCSITLLRVCILRMSQLTLMTLCCITSLLIGRQLCWRDESSVVSQSFIVLILCSRGRVKLYFSTCDGATESLDCDGLYFHCCN